MFPLQPSFKKLFTVLLAASAITFAGCGNNATETNTIDSTANINSDSAAMGTQTTGPAANNASAVLSGTQADTTVTGTARFEEADGKVKLVLDLTVPKKANQSVAVHIHEHGDCGDMGKGAHGHWNPTSSKHGKWGTAAFHVGDIGNVTLDGEGKGSMTLETDLWTITGSDTTKNILNKAIIVHGGVDDFTTQPTGNAGSRIGCGVIKKN